MSSFSQNDQRILSATCLTPYYAKNSLGRFRVFAQSEEDVSLMLGLLTSFGRFSEGPSTNILLVLFLEDFARHLNPLTA